jgi:hypothetical protein
LGDFLVCRERINRFRFDFDRNASCSAIFQDPTLFERQKTLENGGLTPIEKQLQRGGLTPVLLFEAPRFTPGVDVD